MNARFQATNLHPYLEHTEIPDGVILYEFCQFNVYETMIQFKNYDYQKADIY